MSADRVAVECQYGASYPPCNHDACVEFAYGPLHAPAPTYTAEDECAGRGHAYCGDDAGRGRCYCGEQTYPEGGRSSGR